MDPTGLAPMTFDDLEHLRALRMIGFSCAGLAWGMFVWMLIVDFWETED